MKQFVTLAKNSINDRDGFLNGVFKGATGSAAIIVTLCILAGYLG